MSFTQYLQGKAIQTGCEWRLKIQVTSSALAAFPVTATFASTIRRDSANGLEYLTLTTGNRGVNRISDNALELILTGEQTSNLDAGMVVLDIIRTDLPEKIHLGFDLEIPVKRTITRV